MDMILTERELELLLLIKSICEFDAENPGNIPEGGIGEIAVSNGIYEPDEYKECLQELKQLKLVDGDEKITEAGNDCLIEYYTEAEKICKEKGIENPFAEQLQQLREFSEQPHKEKITLEQVVSNVCKMVAILHGLLKSVEILGKLFSK